MLDGARMAGAGRSEVELPSSLLQLVTSGRHEEKYFLLRWIVMAVICCGRLLSVCWLIGKTCLELLNLKFAFDCVKLHAFRTCAAKIVAGNLNALMRSCRIIHRATIKHSN